MVAAGAVWTSDTRVPVALLATVSVWGVNELVPLYLAVLLSLTSSIYAPLAKNSLDPVPLFHLEPIFQSLNVIFIDCAWDTLNIFTSYLCFGWEKMIQI